MASSCIRRSSTIRPMTSWCVATQANPEAAAARGLWGDQDFVERVAELNPKLKHTQFADYHGHGWVFRAVFKHDRKGNLLDLERQQDRASTIREKFAKAVHLKDVHLAHGMQCADCHFDIDVHGNGMLYGEPRNATTITCIDCHGTIDQRPTLITSGNAGQIDLLQHEQHAVGSAFHLGRNHALSAIDHVAGCALGSSANDRHD